MNDAVIAHAQKTLAQLLEHLESHSTIRHRRIVVLTGPQQWGVAVGNMLLAAEKYTSPAWIGDSPKALNDDLSDAKQLLGGEIDLLIYDAWMGFSPNEFAAASGALVGGGVLLLLTPPLTQWGQFADPDYSRMQVFPYKTEEISGRFLSRVAQSFVVGNKALVLAPGNTLSIPEIAAGNKSVPKTNADKDCLTEDQSRAVEAIIHTAQGRPKRPLVLTADRGRGKSSALGVACARLTAADNWSIIVTGPRRSSVDKLFYHAARLLPDAVVKRNSIVYKQSTISFCAPDELDISKPEADLLLIDEAAAIPASKLVSFFHSYKRIVYSTTVHGYEGSGKGFDIRFKSILEQLAPQRKTLKMHQAIRWDEGDPLEQWLYDTLLLGASGVASNLLKEFSLSQCVIDKIDRDELALKNSLLSQLFGLLVDAHYQTTPDDLRNLLDGPNVEIWIGYFKGVVVAAAVVAVEGKFDSSISKLIFSGERRPRGHLLPQTLAFHNGVEQAAAYSYHRIVRIAVHPDLRRQGLGQLLVDSIINNARDHQIDAVGASFAVSENLLKFWWDVGCSPVRMGVTHNASSGSHSVVVLSALTEQAGTLVTAMRDTFSEQFPWMINRVFHSVEPKIIAAIMLDIDVSRYQLSEHIWSAVTTFSQTNRQYESCAYALWNFTCHAFTKKIVQSQLSSQQRDLLVLRVLQGKTEAEVIRILGLSGKKLFTSQLKASINVLRIALTTESDE